MHKLIFLIAFLIAPLTIAHAEQSASEGQKHGPKHGEYKGAIATEYPDWFKASFLNFEEDIQEAGENNKRVMLYFHQDGCPYCNALVERNMSQKNVKELLQTRFDVIAINMWGDREVVSVAGNAYTEKSFAEALKVQFTPTLIFFNEQGKIILRLNGYLPPQNFLLALRYVADKLETQQQYRSYIKANLVTSSGGDLNEQSFFALPPHDLTLSDNQPWARPLAVFFEQKQCPNCDSLHQKVLTDPDTRTVIEKFKVVQLDMWSKDTMIILPNGETASARDWAQQLDIKYAPTIVVFARNGEEVIRTEAYFKVFHTQSIFHYVLSEAYTTQPNFQRYLSARADALLEQGIDVDIWR